MGLFWVSDVKSTQAQLGRLWDEAFQIQDLNALIGVARTAKFLRNQYDLRFRIFADGAESCVREMINFRLSRRDWVSFAKATPTGP